MKKLQVCLVAALMPLATVSAQHTARSVKPGERIEVVTRSAGPDRAVTGMYLGQTRDSLLIRERNGVPPRSVGIGDVSRVRINTQRRRPVAGFAAGAIGGTIIAFLVHAGDERRSVDTNYVCWAFDPYSDNCTERVRMSMVDRTPEWVTPVLVGSFGIIGALAASRERWEAAVLAAPPPIVVRGELRIPTIFVRVRRAF